MTRVFVADARRRWSDEEKRAIIEESRSNPVARVAKKHGLASSLLFRWRKAEGIIGVRGRPARTSHEGTFIPVALPTSAAGPAGPGGVAILLSCGARLLVEKDTDLALLKRVIAALM